MNRRKFVLYGFLPLPFLFMNDIPKLPKLPKRREPEFIPVPHPKVDPTKVMVRYSTDPNDPDYNYFVTMQSAMLSGV